VYTVREAHFDEGDCRRRLRRKGGECGPCFTFRRQLGVDEQGQFFELGSVQGQLRVDPSRRVPLFNVLSLQASIDGGGKGVGTREVDAVAGVTQTERVLGVACVQHEPKREPFV
jgi:hypothetical protein